MRIVLLAAVYAAAAGLTALPAQAGPLNCWYEEIRGPDIDIDGDNSPDPFSGEILGYIAHCEGVESEEVQP